VGGEAEAVEDKKQPESSNGEKSPIQ